MTPSTRNTLITALRKQHGITKKKANEIIDTIFDLMIYKIKEEKRSFILRGFGAFNVVRRKAKKARDIKKGIQIQLPSRLVVKFKPYFEIDETI